MALGKLLALSEPHFSWSVIWCTELLEGDGGEGWWLLLGNRFSCRQCLVSLVMAVCSEILKEGIHLSLGPGQGLHHQKH